MSFVVGLQSLSLVQLCCDPLPGSSVDGIAQARILQWVAISPGDLPNPGMEPTSPVLAGGFFCC